MTEPMPESPSAMPVALAVDCSATVTHPDGTTDGGNEGED